MLKVVRRSTPSLNHCEIWREEDLKKLPDDPNQSLNGLTTSADGVVSGNLKCLYCSSLTKSIRDNCELYLILILLTHKHPRRPYCSISRQRWCGR